MGRSFCGGAVARGKRWNGRRGRGFGVALSDERIFFLVFFNYYLRNESDKSFFSFLSHVNPYDVSYEGVVTI
jgi:hypothetical protein